jgi:predicted ATPase/class 3 adenylate cyclase
MFTDIEGSTRLLRALGPAYPGLLERHAALVRTALDAEEGTEVGTEGDSFFAVFRTGAHAIRAAVAIQRAMANEPWPDGERVPVRIGLHSGEGRLGGDSYVGLDLHRAARIAAAGQGGQVLLSATTQALVAGAIPEGVAIRDLGSHRLKDLEQPEQIAQLVIEGLASDFPPIRSLAAPLRLPAQLSSFVGRAAELQEVSALLESTRLLTLLGPGGTGKTRLAIEAGRQLARRFRDGVVFVDLAPLVDPRLVESGIARAMGLSEQASRPIVEILAEHVREREMLMILDNFEHVLPAADGVAVLLAGAPQLRALVTSRTILNLRGEQTYLVPPMPLPDAGANSDPQALLRYEAVALFVERARAASPHFELTASAAAAVAAICVRLDGLPLAIELAASRTRVLEPAEILDGLRSTPQVLGEGPRDLPERQRTLRSTIDWSYRLLAPSERTLFARLAVFDGGCTLKAADAVCNPANELGLLTIDGLSALVDHSLVRRVDAAAGSRFRMLETIRDFGREALAADGDLAASTDRHLTYHRALAEQALADRAFVGREQAAWLDRFEAEHDNVRAALRHAVESGASEEGLRLAGAIWRFWMQRGYLREGRAWIEALLAAAGPEPTPGRAAAYSALGGLAYWLSDAASTETSYDEALRLRRALGDRNGEAEALYDRAFVPVLSGDYVEAERAFEAARALAIELGRGDLEAQCNNSLGTLVALAGEPERGLDILERAVAYMRAHDEEVQLPWALAQLAQVEWRMGKLAESRAHSLESLRRNVQAESLPGIGANLDAIAALESTAGRHREAARLIGVGRSLMAKIGVQAPPLFTRAGEVEARAREALGDEAVEHELAAGARMTMRDAVACISELPL